MDLPSSTRLLKALGDESRLRILNLLQHEELSCSDLVAVLNMAQSRVSTHLGLLREVGLVADRKAGRRAFYRLCPEAAGELLSEILAANQSCAEFAADHAEYKAWKEREQGAARSYFDRVAASFGEQTLPGRTWEGLARAVLRLAPAGHYADLGVGDGLLTMMLAQVATQVTAVDVSPKMLAELTRRCTKEGLNNVIPVEGALDDLPLEDETFDVVVLSQALHHAESPERALQEALRTLVPGGRVLIIDLLAHAEDWVRAKYHHRHLGFTEAELRELLLNTGFVDLELVRAARDSEPPHFLSLVAVGHRPLSTEHSQVGDVAVSCETNGSARAPKNGASKNGSAKSRSRSATSSNARASSAAKRTAKNS